MVSDVDEVAGAKYVIVFEYVEEVEFGHQLSEDTDHTDAVIV